MAEQCERIVCHVKVDDTHSDSVAVQGEMVGAPTAGPTSPGSRTCQSAPLSEPCCHPAPLTVSCSNHCTTAPAQNPITRVAAVLPSAGAAQVLRMHGARTPPPVGHCPFVETSTKHLGTVGSEKSSSGPLAHCLACRMWFVLLCTNYLTHSLSSEKCHLKLS